MKEDNPISSVSLLPQIPGNYPKDFLGTIQNNGSDVYQELQESTGTILALDMRNFTRTVERRPSRIINNFLNDFFEEISLRIQKYPYGYVNKYLGDGLLAHFKDIQPHQAIELAFEILQSFQIQKKKNNLNFIGLTQVISKDAYFTGTIGRTNYIDFTIIGKNINRVFRLLSQGKGDCIYITEQLLNAVNDKFIALNAELHVLDGIGIVVASHMVFRPKSPDEMEHDVTNTCDDSCLLFKYCHEAWVSGRSGKDYIDCNRCFTQTHEPSCECDLCRTKKHELDCKCGGCKQVRHCVWHNEGYGFCFEWVINDLV